MCCGGLALWIAQPGAWLQLSTVSFKNQLGDYGSLVDAVCLVVAAKYKFIRQLR